MPEAVAKASSAPSSGRHALLEHPHRRVAVAGIDELVGTGGDEPRLGGRRVRVDEALGQEDRLGGLAVLAAAGAAMHQPRPRAPVLAHCHALRVDPRPPLPPGGSRQRNSRGVAKMAAAVNGRAVAPSSRTSPACHRELTAFRLAFGRSQCDVRDRAWPISASRRRDGGLRAAMSGERIDAGLRRHCGAAKPEGADRGAGARLQVPSRAGQPPIRTGRCSRCARMAISWRIRSWPEGLGFAEDHGETGLCVGFAWPASAPHLASLVSDGRTDSPGSTTEPEPAGTARRAGGGPAAAGAGPAGRRARPFARRARGAGRAAASGGGAGPRSILLGAAEFDARAREFIAARAGPQPPQIYNVTARANDLYDLLFETSRRGATGASGRSASASAPGCRLARPAARPARDVTAWINAQGIPLTAPRAAALPLELLHPRGRARRLPGDPAAAAGLGHRQPARRPLLRARRSRAGAGWFRGAASTPTAAAADAERRLIARPARAIWRGQRDLPGRTMTQPIELYFWPTPNGYKITIALHEMDLPYDVHLVNIGKGEQFRPEFLAISPNNRMPAIVDPEGPDGVPISVFESGAILQYLGRKTGKLLRPRRARAGRDRAVAVLAGRRRRADGRPGAPLPELRPEHAIRRTTCPMRRAATATRSAGSTAC